MKVCVYGAGAVGGHLAVRLAQAGATMSVIARGAHGAAIRAHGLTLLRGDERITARPSCTEDPATLPPQDVVVVTVKGPGLGAVAPALAPLLTSDSRVVFAMNGIPWWFGDGFSVPLPDALRATLDPGGTLGRTLTPAQVVGCAIYSGNAMETPGVIRNTTPQRNRMIVGRPDGTTDRFIDDFAALVRRAGIEAEVTPRIREALWIKMQIIVAASPIAALSRCTIGEIVDDPGLRAVAVSLLRETFTLGRALGLDLADDDAPARIDYYRGSKVKPSMLQDLEAGKPLEVDNGILAFRALAHAAGHPAPAMDTVGALVGALARSTAAR